MKNITSAATLKNAIQLLEVEQAINEQLLKDQFYLTVESLKPVNLLKGTIKDIATSPFLIDNILGSVVGLATGYVTKKIVVGASSNILRKLLGSVVQVGVSNAVAKHPEEIKTLGQYIFQKIFRRKEHRFSAAE